MRERRSGGSHLFAVPPRSVLHEIGNDQRLMLHKPLHIYVRLGKNGRTLKRALPRSVAVGPCVGHDTEISYYNACHNQEIDE